MSNYCPKCHSELKPGAKFCGRCGEIVSAAPAAYAPMGADSYGRHAPATPAAPAAPVAPAAPASRAPHAPGGRIGMYMDESRRRNQMPQGIDLGVGEVIVKQYRVALYTLRRGYIDVIVTNKRVIRYEESSLLWMQTNQINEINIDAVNGVSCLMSRSLSVIRFTLALALIICGLVTLIGGLGFSGLVFGSNVGLVIGGIVILALGGVTLFFSFRPSLLFSLQGAAASSTLDTAINILGRIFRNTQGLIFKFRPTAETTVMLREIGACIYDLKTLGDSAIEKWRG